MIARDTERVTRPAQRREHATALARGQRPVAEVDDGTHATQRLAHVVDRDREIKT
jgi:hypothetical protein